MSFLPYPPPPEPGWYDDDATVMPSFVDSAMPGTIAISADGAGFHVAGTNQRRTGALPHSRMGTRHGIGPLLAWHDADPRRGWRASRWREALCACGRGGGHSCRFGARGKSPHAGPDQSGSTTAYPEQIHSFTQTGNTTHRVTIHLARINALPRKITGQPPRTVLRQQKAIALAQGDRHRHALHFQPTLSLHHSVVNLMPSGGGKSRAQSPPAQRGRRNRRDGSLTVPPRRTGYP